MEKEILKVTQVELPTQKCLKIELDGSADDIALALFEVIDTQETIRTAVGDICKQQLLKNIRFL